MIAQLRSKIAKDQFEFSQHAVDQSIIRHISIQEIREAFENCQIVEDYPDDKYGPSCLVLGFTLANRPLVKIVTLYEPDPEEWVDFRTRKP